MSEEICAKLLTVPTPVFIYCQPILFLQLTLLAKEKGDNRLPKFYLAHKYVAHNKAFLHNRSKALLISSYKGNFADICSPILNIIDLSDLSATDLSPMNQSPVLSFSFRENVFRRIS